MTPADFRALRQDFGIGWGRRRDPESFPSERAYAAWQVEQIGAALNMNEKTIRVWERDGERGPHPTAVRVLGWWKDGLRRPRGQSPDLDAMAFGDARFELGLSVEALAYVLDVESEIIEVWEKERGPHPAAMRAMEWLLAGFEPPELEAFLQAQG